MSELAALIAQLTGPAPQSAPDTALSAVKLARASIDALVLKLGQSIDAKVVGQLAAGLTQLTAGNESFVLKLETPLPTGTAVTIKVATTPQGTPAVTVSVPATMPQAAQPMPVPTPTAPLVQAQVAPPAPAPANVTPATSQSLPQATQLPLPEPVAPPLPVPADRSQPQPVAQSASPVPQPAPQPTATAPQLPSQPAAPQVAASANATEPPPPPPPPPASPAPQRVATAQSPPSALPASPSPTPGQSAAPVPLLATPAAPPSVAAQPPTTPVPTVAPVLPTTTPAVAWPVVIAAPPVAAPVAAVQPAPVLTPPLAAQQQQPLPTHPSPYPMQVPQAATTAVARQLPLAVSPAAVPRPAAPSVAAPNVAAPSVAAPGVAAPGIAAPKPAAPPLNLADPAQAAARQDSAAPLLAKLATLVTAATPSLPRPVLEMALKLLANRVDLNRAPPDAKTIEAGVLKAGVLLTPLTRAPASDSKSALLALRSTLLAFLGGDTAAPVATAERPAPPIKGEPPRAPGPQAAVPDLSSDAHDTARTLLGHTDAALSRLKLLQSASQPADIRADAPAPRNELRVEIPMLLGTETGILQLMVERDAKHKREPDRQRGWRMRFAMNFSATGEVGADIALLGHSASIAIWAADPDTADALDDLLPELAPAIQRHGLELTSLRVRRGAPQPARTAPGRLLDSAR